MALAEIETPTQERGRNPYYVIKPIGEIALIDGMNQESTELPGICEFLDSKTKLPVEEQLAFMSSFWDELGVNHSPNSTNMPEAKLEALRVAATAHPDKRIIPTPIVPAGGAEFILRKGAQVFSESFKNSIQDLDNPVIMPRNSTLGSLLAEPEEEVSTLEVTRTNGDILTKEVTKFLGHRSLLDPSKVVSHEDYIKERQESSEAVIGEDGISWVFPAVDVAPQDQSGRLVKEIYEDVDPLASSETGAVVELLQLVNNSPNQQRITVNEGVYEKQKKRFFGLLAGKISLLNTLGISLIPNMAVAITSQKADSLAAVRADRPQEYRLRNSGTRYSLDAS